MQAYKIADIKDFMNKLLIGDVFDSFYLAEATITTFNTFSIDGKLKLDFYNTDEQTLLKEKQRTLSSWKEIKPFCYSIIKGKHTPLSFKIVLQLSRPQTAQILNHANLNYASDAIHGFCLNLQYKNRELFCTTGIALNVFFPDKKPELLWDSMIPDFLRKHNILFEELI